VISCLTN